MRRDTLKQLLAAGPSRRLDVSGVSQVISRLEQDRVYFFATWFLNSSVFIKYVDPDCAVFRDRARPVGTLIYMPYDVRRPGDGGESAIFSPNEFTKIYAAKITSGGADGKDLAADAEKLRILDSLPTFNPFIIELAFRRAQIDVPDTYLKLTPALRGKLTAHLVGRLRPLVVATFQNAAAELEGKVEDLTAKLLFLKDMEELQPLIEALRLSPDLAQDVLGSWIAITYYEYEFAAMQLRLQEFATWISQTQRMVDALPTGHRASISPLVEDVRRQVRGDWSEMIAISEKYRSSYEAIVFEEDFEPFVAFLRIAQGSFWRMGEVFGKLEQAVRVWARYIPSPRERQAYSPQLVETLSVLRDLLLDGGPHSQACGTPRDGRAAARP